MNWVFTPYALPLLLGAAVACALAVYTWRLEHAPGARPLTVLLIGAAIWSMADALEIGSVDLPTKLMWTKVSYLGTVAVPLAWLAFAVEYTGRWPLSRVALALLLIEPVATLLVAWTNERHGLLWSSLGIDSSGPFVRMTREYGTWFWLHTTYSYLLIGVGTFLLIAMGWRLRRVYRGQSLVLLASVTISWLANALYLSRSTPISNVDLTSFAFIGFGLIMALGLFRLRVLEVFPGLIPIARDTIVEAMSDGVLVVDRRHRIVDLNSAAQEILGCSDEAIGQRADAVVAGWSKLVPGLNVESGGRSQVVIGEDAARRYIDIRISPLRRHDGYSVGCLLVFRDVTDRQLAEIEREQLLSRLRDANNDLAVATGRARVHAERAEREAWQLSALLASLGDAVEIAGPGGRIVLRNEMAQAITGLSDSEAEELRPGPRPVFSSLDHIPLPFDEWPLTRARHGEQFSDLEVIYHHPDGSTRWLLASGSGVRDEKGGLALGLVVYRDVTRIRELQRTREEYQRAISHDLRAPLTVVLGHAQLIQKLLDQPERVGRAAAAIATSADRMNRMIQDLVDSARLESGDIQLMPVPLDLHRFVLELRDRMGALELGSSQRFQIDAAEGLPPVLGDPVRLERILTNLMTNALKYSDPDTEVTIRLREGEGEVETAIVDRGNGIPPEELPLLFDRYYRGSAGREQRDSLGLGLYITRKLVEAHHGRLWVDSQVGTGSAFRFTLPTSYPTG